MADDAPPAAGHRRVALRVVLFVMALGFAGLVLPAFASQHQIDAFVADYLDWVGLTHSDNDTPDADTEPVLPPNARLEADPLAMFLLRLASLAMAVPTLLCLIAMARPGRSRAVLAGLTIGAFVVGGGSVWLGRREGIDLLLYAPVAIVALVGAILLLALFPFEGSGGGGEEGG